MLVLTESDVLADSLEGRLLSQADISILDLVSFPVLSQIKPQAPLLVVPFRQFL